MVLLAAFELAFKEHQSTLNSVMNSAVRDAMDSVLIPALCGLREDIQATNESVKELREDFEAIVTTAKQTRDRVDSVQAAAREDKRTVTDLKDQLERLTEKMTDMGDHVTPRRWCRLSFSLRSLCQIFHDPVSEIWITLH